MNLMIKFIFTEIVPNIIEFGNLLQTYSFVDIDSYLKMLSYTEKQVLDKRWVRGFYHC